jgi:hypothetical protein
MLRIPTLALVAVLSGPRAVPAPSPAERPPAHELLVENTDRGTVHRIHLRPGEVFSVQYHHSMYDQPVTEDFVVDEGGRIVLRAVTSPSAAVREYFGITSAGDRHPMERTMAEIVFRIAAGTVQRLRAGGVERSFLDFGDHGDRLVLRVDPS